MTLSDDVRSALQSKQQEEAGLRARQEAEKAERERKKVHWINLRSCGTFECTVGKVWLWEPELLPADTQPKDNVYEWLALPKHRFGTPEWAATNARICREAVEQMWLHTASVIVKYGHVDAVLAAVISDPAQKTIVEPFRELLRTLSRGEPAEDVVKQAAANLADVRCELREACQEISRAFGALADAAFGPKPIQKAVPVKTAKVPEPVIADERHRTIRERLGNDERTALVIAVLARVEALPGPTVSVQQLVSAGIPRTTINSAAISGEWSDSAGQFTNERRFRKDKVIGYLVHRWVPRIGGQATDD
jgi:hypothetical protein